MPESAATKRITYPLTVKEVEELQGLVAQMKSKAEAAQRSNRIGLHRAYTDLMKATTKVVTRETNRMSRESLARYSREQRELKKLAKDNPSSQMPTDDEDIAS